MSLNGVEEFFIADVGSSCFTVAESTKRKRFSNAPSAGFARRYNS